MGTRKKLGELLRDAGLLSEAQLQAALAEQKKWGGKLGRIVVDLGFVDEETLVLALSRQLGLPAVDLEAMGLPAHVVQHLRVDLAERYGVFPVDGDEERGTLTLAVSDPTNTEALRDITQRTGRKVQLVLATSSAIDRVTRRLYYGETGHEEAALPLVEALPAQELPPEVVARLEGLEERVESLERLMASQVRALRGLLEVLVDSGVVRREDYLARVRGERPH